MATIATQLSSHFEMRTGRQRLIGLALFGLALLACLLALTAFPNDATAPNGWLPYLGSTALFIAACYVLFPYKKAEARLAPLTRQLITIGVLILSLATVMRLYRLNDLPFGVWNDETYIATIAKSILADPNYRPFFVASYDHPLHFYALVALSFRILGVSTESIRIVTTAFGLATVVLAFMTGREAFGNRFGLILAFLFAISRWHVTFSRFGVYTISLPFFELLTIWLLLRARRTGQLHDFAWAGLALGYGLNFYIAVRLFVGVVFIYILYRLVTTFWRRLAEELPQSKTALLGGLAAFVLAASLAAAPLIQYALANPDQYWGRANQVSIFAQYDPADWPKALYLNTVKHLSMFNLEGDHNGRHNLPGEPMLDPIMGVLFVLGLALTVSRVNLPVNLLMLTLFGINLLGGILTLDFEAPQSNRAFGAIVAVLYFAALSVETLLRSLDQTRPPASLRRTVLTLAALGFGGYIVFYNAQTFFVKQANNDRVWQEYNGPQSLTAKRMLEAHSKGMRIYASVFLNDHEATRFLAPEITDSRMIVPPVGLP
ncbi:MAG TPA: glycosyltransferase family 39 protein, partial [Anaerolineales bacterium]|nr:glycosyltransferase family 39 protein [Anaerolineales bacterium]